MEYVEVVIAFIAGGGAVELIKRLFERRVNEQVLQSEFYEMWDRELKRLRIEIDTLHALVAALESELIALGGDPYRIRKKAIEDMGNGGL